MEETLLENVDRLILSGSEDEEIALVTGYSIKSVQDERARLEGSNE